MDYTTKYFTRNIFRIVVEEGASTCVMSVVCWKAIGHPSLSLSPTFLTMFDGQLFKPHGIIHSFPMRLGKNTVCVKVEVVDEPLDYNLFLGRTWTYVMHAVVAMVFQVLCFPHDYRIVTIDQLSFSHPDPSSGASMVPMIDNLQPDIVNLGVGLFPSLMGTFDYPLTSSNFKLILIVPDQPRVVILQVSSFQMSYFNDPWTILSPSASIEGTRHPGMAIPLFAAEVAYIIVKQALARPDLTPPQELVLVLEPIWARGFLSTQDPLELVFPSDEEILEALNVLIDVGMIYIIDLTSFLR
jgi:hypothetical protein